jgi:hypothetical protein
MKGRMRYNSKLETLSLRYIVAIALAAAAQAVRIPLHPPTLIPFITYAPFMAVSAGFGGGLLFAIEPVRSFAMSDPTNWYGIGALAMTTAARSILAERLKRTGKETEESNHGESA